MRVLVACEESQTVCAAFRARGHEAYSCDIQHCALWNHLEWHIVEPAETLINGNCEFMTVNGDRHSIDGPWDLLIAHPPCTYLTAASSVRLFEKDHSIRDFDRLEKGCAGRRLFYTFWNAKCQRIAIENPVPLKLWKLPAWSQIIDPYEFGDPWRKRTCLWLKGLPELKLTHVVEPEGLWVGSSSKQKTSKYHLKSNRDSKTRSKTFPGIAEAMAEQWGK